MTYTHEQLRLAIAAMEAGEPMEHKASIRLARAHAAALEEIDLLKAALGDADRETERAEAARDDCKVAMQAALLQRDQERARAEAMLEGVENSIVDEIGGTVEAVPTNRLNYLQRIRQLVRAEAALAEAERKCERLSAQMKQMENERREDLRSAAAEASRAERFPDEPYGTY